MQFIIKKFIMIQPQESEANHEPYSFKQKLNVCVLLTPIESTSVPTNTSQLETNLFQYGLDVQQVLKRLNCNVEMVNLSPEKPMALHQIKKRQKTTDVFLNLNESANQDLDQVLIDYMGDNGIPFTGSRILTAINRDKMKQICRENDIPTSPYIFVDDFEDLKRYKEVGEFPLFVKPEDGQGSLCISEKSIVRNEQQLRERVEYVWSKFGGALIQRFIQGDEFTVLVAGSKDNCHSFTALKHIFEENRSVVSFEDKFGTSYKPAWQKVQDKKLDSELQRLAKKFYLCAGIDGYARFDFRQDKVTKILYLIDPNIYCSLYITNDNCSADMAVKISGWSKQKFTRFLIDQAFKRSRQFHNNLKQQEEAKI